ncbi:hypothetical protein BaRGS_00011082 [Batillaria attramentaria]|uniref:Uncharacterized protein n=1 Tax=Batillaria attramentaria TaxID=370345 RepID=A0ABD0LDP4_9CAEN
MQFNKRCDVTSFGPHGPWSSTRYCLSLDNSLHVTGRAGEAQIIVPVPATTPAAAEAPTETVMEHLLQRLADVFAEAGVEETVDERVDGVVDEEGLHAELVSDLTHRAQAALEILDSAAKDHHDQVREETQDVGEGDGEEYRGCLPTRICLLLTCGVVSSAPFFLPLPRGRVPVVKLLLLFRLCWFSAAAASASEESSVLVWSDPCSKKNNKKS